MKSIRSVAGVFFLTLLALFVLSATPRHAFAQHTRRKASPAQGTLVISGYGGQSASYNANGRVVVVNGSNKNVNIRGRARELRVSGTNNHVRINAVRAIQVTGSRNRIQYYSGWYKNISPTSQIAAGNVVEKAK